MTTWSFTHRDHLQTLMDRFDCSFFCYDLDALDEHLKSMQKMIPEGVKLWYATKANPLSEVLKTFRKNGFGIDVSAQGEMNHALNAGFNPSSMLSTGPSKSRKYLRSLVDHGIGTVVLESPNQARWLNEIALEKNQVVDVLLRVQLPWKEGKSVLGGDEITAFGMEPDAWKQSEVTSMKGLNIRGFHCFQWGNILDAKRLGSIWSTIAQKLVELSDEMSIELEVLDLGGGLGLDYEEHQSPLQFEDVSAELKKIKENFNVPEIWMELGRYAVGNFGVYCTQIIDRKSTRGRELLVTDGGINHLVRPAITNQAFPCELFRTSESQSMRYHVHGPLCTALDVLGSFELPSDIGPGDWLVFKKTMAYGFTESMPFFLCHNLPAETIIKDGSLEVLRGIETAASWLV
ncbi:MAG: PLP-dependent decarboxylase [Deltaproteobacteria bacterium]|nr:MAG: PLP-dependent decarboxylase [Deltaproteobacteria bacterium]TNF30533.1 MAG: PLP-dependent decarboxylase [Deltaproteobacteria bacterium]